MTVTDYITRKNEIIEKHTGIVLVPADQVENIEIGSTRLSMQADPEACPYCAKFYVHDYNERCAGCPMHNAYNSCFKAGSTYTQITDKYSAIVAEVNPWFDELAQLVKEYNDDLIGGM